MVNSRMMWIAFALIIALLVAIALLIPGGGEKLVARATTKAPLATMRDCLGTGLGLGTWQGSDKAIHATALGLRVVVTDNGHDRTIGLFTAGGRQLSSGQSKAFVTCLGGS
jgi:hypothetical protein